MTFKLSDYPRPESSIFDGAPIPLVRRREEVEPFARLARGMPVLPFTTEILAARAELARAYRAREQR